MFDWSLWLLLILVCVPGVAVVAPRLVKSMERTIQSRLKPGQSPPPKAQMLLVAGLQSLILVGVLAAVGVALAPRVGLAAPFFSALVSDAPAWPALRVQLLPALLLGIAGGALFVAAYYTVFRPRFDTQTLVASERLRQDLGPAGRLLYGGIVEEVIARWGLMTLFVWLAFLVVGEVNPWVMGAGLLISGVLFGLGHLPSYAGAGARLTRMYVSFAIVMNLWASIIFGLLYWQVGLAAAMLAHMVFHLVWLPFERPAPALEDLVEVAH